MIYYKELAHMAKEDEKSKDLHQQAGDSGKPRTWFPSESEDLITKRAEGPHSSLSLRLKAGEDSSSSV